MASDSSFDIVSQFDLQELRNAVDQTQKQVATRYDLKDSHIEIILNENDITLIAPDSMKLNAVRDVLLQRVINRKLSPKVLQPQEPEPAANSSLRQMIKLVKALDQERCKTISKMIRDAFPKVKPSIQGDVVRVSSKNKDDLQMVIQFLREDKTLDVPLQFTNYR